MTGRRTVVLLGLLGAGLVLLAGTRTWATITITGGVLPGLSELTVSGRRTAPGMIAIAVAAGAGAVVLTTAGRAIRFLIAAGLVVAGVAVAVGGVQVTRDTSGVVATALRDSLRVSGSTSGGFGGPASVDLSIWPVMAGFGGLLVLAAGLLALVGGRTWSGPSRRYERVPAADEPVPTAAWDALSRGEDPTSASGSST